MAGEHVRAVSQWVKDPIVTLLVVGTALGSRKRKLKVQGSATVFATFLKVICFLPTPNLNLSEILYLKGYYVSNTQPNT